MPYTELRIHHTGMFYKYCYILIVFSPEISNLELTPHLELPHFINPMYAAKIKKQVDAARISRLSYQ